MTRAFIFPVTLLAAIASVVPASPAQAGWILAPGTYRAVVILEPQAGLSPCTDELAGHFLTVDFTLSRLGGGAWQLRFEGRAHPGEPPSWLRGVGRFGPDWRGVELDQRTSYVYSLDLAHLEQLNVVGRVALTDGSIANVHLALGPGGSVRDCRTAGERRPAP